MTTPTDAHVSAATALAAVAGALDSYRAIVREAGIGRDALDDLTLMDDLRNRDDLAGTPVQTMAALLAADAHAADDSMRAHLGQWWLDRVLELLDEHGLREHDGGRCDYCRAPLTDGADWNGKCDTCADLVYAHTDGDHDDDPNPACPDCPGEAEWAGITAEVDRIGAEHRQATGCTGVPAEANGVCTVCGADLLGVSDDDEDEDLGILSERAARMARGTVGWEG